MSRDLRSFIEDMKNKAPELLLSVEREISPHFEASALMWNLEKQDKCPVCIFQNALDHYGEKSEFKMASNIFGDRRNCAIAMGLNKDQALLPASLEFWRRERSPIDPVVIDAKDAPVKQVVKTGDQIDLFKIPAMSIHEMDCGPYINTVCIVQDPDLPGNYNASHHRMQVKGKNRTGFFTSPRHLWNYMNRSFEKGEPFPLVQVLGHHPGFYLGAETLAPMEVSEYSVQGGIIGEPLRLVPSQTWGDKFLVPADAEMVIEGVLLPGKREAEAPYGEWPGYYGPQKWGWVFEARNITHRRDAICMTQFIGHRDAANIGGISKEGGVYQAVRNVVPTVKAVHIPWSGNMRQIVYISIDQKAEGEARFAGLAAFPLHDEIKYVVVVDKDIDVFDEREVWWAVATRSQPGDDVEIIKKARGGICDPSQDHPQWGSKLLIDATMPVDRPFAKRLSMSSEYLKKMDPAGYVSAEFLDKIPKVI